MSTIILLILVIIVLVVVGIFFFTQFAQGQTGVNSAQGVVSSGIDKFLGTEVPDELTGTSVCRTFCEDAVKYAKTITKDSFANGMQSGFCSGIHVKDKGTKYCGELFGGCGLTFSDGSCIASCSGNTLKCS